MSRFSWVKQVGDWLFHFFIAVVMFTVFAAGIAGFFRYTIDDICEAIVHEQNARAKQVQDRVAANSMANFMRSE